MAGPVCVSVRVPDPDPGEIRRYAGCPEGSDELLLEVLSELSPLSYRVAYCELPLQKGDCPALGFTADDSRDLSKALAGCDRILLFAATIGRLPDVLAARYNRLSPAKALFLQAVGTERIEALCDAFCREKAGQYAKKGDLLRPRFSPGYGDLPLALQKRIFDVLDLPRALGLTLTGSLLMVPTKSVTAIAGIART